MYNIDGDIIMGQGASLKKQKGTNAPIYDEEEVFLQKHIIKINSLLRNREFLKYWTWKV